MEQLGRTGLALPGYSRQQQGLRAELCRAAGVRVAERGSPTAFPRSEFVLEPTVWSLTAARRADGGTWEDRLFLPVLSLPSPSAVASQ